MFCLFSFVPFWCYSFFTQIVPIARWGVILNAFVCACYVHFGHNSEASAHTKHVPFDWLQLIGQNPLLFTPLHVKLKILKMARDVSFGLRFNLKNAIVLEEPHKFIRLNTHKENLLHLHAAKLNFSLKVFFYFFCLVFLCIFSSLNQKKSRDHTESIAIEPVQFWWVAWKWPRWTCMLMWHIPSNSPILKRSNAIQIFAAPKNNAGYFFLYFFSHLLNFCLVDIRSLHIWRKLSHLKCQWAWNLMFESDSGFLFCSLIASRCSFWAKLNRASTAI